MQDASTGGQNQQHIFANEIKQRMAPGRAGQYRSLGSFLEGLLQHGISVNMHHLPHQKSRSNTKQLSYLCPSHQQKPDFILIIKGHTALPAYLSM